MRNLIKIWENIAVKDERINVKVNQWNIDKETNKATIYEIFFKKKRTH